MHLALVDAAHHCKILVKPFFVTWGLYAVQLNRGKQFIILDGTLDLHRVIALQGVRHKMKDVFVNRGIDAKSINLTTRARLIMRQLLESRFHGLYVVELFFRR